MAHPSSRRRGRRGAHAFARPPRSHLRRASEGAGVMGVDPLLMGIGQPPAKRPCSPRCGHEAARTGGRGDGGSFRCHPLVLLGHTCAGKGGRVVREAAHQRKGRRCTGFGQVHGAGRRTGGLHRAACHKKAQPANDAKRACTPGRSTSANPAAARCGSRHLFLVALPCCKAHDPGRGGRARGGGDAGVDAQRCRARAAACVHAVRACLAWRRRHALPRPRRWVFLFVMRTDVGQLP